MADIALGGPTATDPTSYGNNWVPQNSTDDDNAERAIARLANGDFAANQLYNHGNTVNVVLENSTAVNGNLTIPDAGAVSNSFLITSVVVAFTPTTCTCPSAKSTT